LVSGSVSAATDIFNVVLARRRGVEDPLTIYHRGNLERKVRLGGT